MMTTKTALIQTIRKHCLDCCGGSYQEVEDCASGPNAKPYSTCALWAFRLGTDPDGPSEARREAGKKLAQRKQVRQMANQIKQVDYGEKVQVWTGTNLF